MPPKLFSGAFPLNDAIIIRGARTHNLKNVSCEIPHGKLTVVSGVSGSGKSSLAFDTIYAEGQRRYVESLSAYARQFLERIEKPDVDEIDGLAPAIAIKQKNSTRNPRSTVATATEIYDYLRLLYARCGTVYCVHCDGLVKRDSVDEAAEAVLALGEGTRLNVLFPVVTATPSPEAVAAAAKTTKPAARTPKSSAARARFYVAGCMAPSPDYREAKGVIANYVEALSKVVPPRVVALSSMGANRTSGVGMITALSLLEQGLRSLPSPVAFVRAGGFFENFLFGLQAAQGGTLPVFYSPTNRKSTMVASGDIGAEVAALLTGPAWLGHRVIELGSMVSADEVARQLGEVLTRDVKAFAVPRAGWAEAFEQFGIPKGHTGAAEEMFESVNTGWMDLGLTGTEHVAGTTSARDVFAAAQNAAKA